jgi:hypothetical protein
MRPACLLLSPVVFGRRGNRQEGHDSAVPNRTYKNSHDMISVVQFMLDVVMKIMVDILIYRH